MTTRPRRTKHGYPSEPQYSTNNGWVVARKRPHRHGYEVLYRGQLVGWVLCQPDGWRWLLQWSPGSASRAPRFGIERLSKRAYHSWQGAVSAIARTDVGARIAGADPPARDTWQRHFAVRGQPWEPTVEKSAAADD